MQNIIVGDIYETEDYHLWLCVSEYGDKHGIGYEFRDISENKDIDCKLLELPRFRQEWKRQLIGFTAQ